MSNIQSIALHKVGNKSSDEPFVLSKSLLSCDEEMKEVLSSYFLNAFTSEEYYRFFHDNNLLMNEVYSYAKAIFQQPEALLEQSVHIARHLYNHSAHPKVKGGELYVAYFTDYTYQGEKLDAIGIFKSENKDTFLQVKLKDDTFNVHTQEGINLHKLDKGCLIINKEQENGFVLSIVDNTNRSVEAQYWKDDFLKVMVMNNHYHQTNLFLGIAKQFVTQQLDEEFELNKADKIDLLNRSVNYFKSNNQFEIESFESEVFQHPNIIESFRQFDQTYRAEHDVDLADSFVISEQAVKKQARVFKSVLKLDKNFHIYIHGDRELIEQGTDEHGRKYYKIYYQNES
jgi:hypothetical protein